MESINSIEYDRDIDTRRIKYSTIVPRLALVFQAIRSVCGESHLKYVDTNSVDSAIRMIGLYDSCVTQLERTVAIIQCASPAIDLLNSCTKDAKAIGEKMQISL